MKTRSHFRSRLSLPCDSQWASLSAAVVVTALLAAGGGWARPGAPVAFCEEYGGEAAICRGRQPTCLLCHTSTGASVGWNPYGDAVYGALVGMGYNPSLDDELLFNSMVGAAARSVENGGDHDNDTVSTLEELALGTGPGNMLDYFLGQADPVGDANPTYNVGGYDYNVAYTRVHVAFCGQSPEFASKEAFAAMSEGDKQNQLHADLDRCMQSGYWKNQALPSLADDRIKPVPRFEQWTWDYRLWRYANLPPCDTDLPTPGCGDAQPRSARDILTGDYHVRELQEGVLTRDEGLSPGAPGGPPVVACDSGADCGYDEFCTGGMNPTCRVVGGYQVLHDDDRDKRAGMISTQWFFFFYTMFSAMPRTTAAQAMRAHLGLDIAQQEGLIYHPTEPADVDNKGVDEVGCIECHMQLDAATYAFVYYNGIFDIGPTGGYNEDRPIQRNLWDSPGEARDAYFFDQLIERPNELPKWAAAAVETDFFRRNHVVTFFRHATGRDPRPDDEADVNALVDFMRDSSYETPLLLHELIDTDAFGGV